MELEPNLQPIMRHEKNFIVEKNIAAVQWPQECSVCGKTYDQKENLKLKTKFKSLGEIQVNVDGIPYCKVCFSKTKSYNRLDTVAWVITIILAIPIFILGLTGMAQNSSGNTVIFLGMYFLLSVAIAYGIVWLLIKLPIRKLFKNRFAKPVSAWLIEDDRPDKTKGVSVVIAIPDKTYAGKFAALNMPAS